MMQLESQAQTRASRPSPRYETSIYQYISTSDWGLRRERQRASVSGFCHLLDTVLKTTAASGDNKLKPRMLCVSHIKKLDLKLGGCGGRDRSASRRGRPCHPSCLSEFDMVHPKTASESRRSDSSFEGFAQCSLCSYIPRDGRIMSHDLFYWLVACT